MADFNKFLATGNLVADPEAFSSKSGNPYTRFRVAINEGWGDKKSTTYVQCTAFGKLADFVSEYGAMGRKVLIDGRLNITSTKDEQTGNWNNFTTIIVNSVQFLDSRENTERKTTAASTDPLSKAYGDDDDDDDSEDIPF